MSVALEATLPPRISQPSMGWGSTTPNFGFVRLYCVIPILGKIRFFRVADCFATQEVLLGVKI